MWSQLRRRDHLIVAKRPRSDERRRGRRGRRGFSCRHTIWFWERAPWGRDVCRSASASSWNWTLYNIFILMKSQLLWGRFHKLAYLITRTKRSEVELKGCPLEVAWWCALGSALEGSRGHCLPDLPHRDSYLTSWRFRFFLHKVEKIVESASQYYCETKRSRIAYTRQLIGTVPRVNVP